jgi:CubicO group peptidase (beta-lactamase class C family)
MNFLFLALHAEVLKLKRTLAVRMIFVAPLLVALLQFFIGLNQRRIAPGFKMWEAVFQNSLSVWAIFMLPLLITLETALLAGIEHGEKQWKHLLALPVPRSTVYAAKLLVALALALASTLVLCALLVLTGYGLLALRPEFGQAGGPDYGWLFQHAGRVWLAAWLIVALHTWIGIRWASFTVALGAGVAGTFFALFAAGARIGKYYPWLLPANALNLIGGERRGPVALLLGGVGGLIVAALGALDFARRDAGEAETTVSRKVMLAGGAAALCFTALGVYLQRPNAAPARVAGHARAERVENGLLSAVTIRGVDRPLKLAERMAFYRVPGVSIAVVNEGKIEWAKGYGVLAADGDEPVTTETRFQAASISKPVAAAAALVLAEQGKLDLDANVNARLRSWRVPENEFTRAETVTLRRLLSHTAGIVEHKYPGYEAGAPLPTALQVLDGLKPARTAPIRVARAPGSVFQYSGGGYLIVQQLLCDATSQPFPDLMQSLIFQPLGMTHSSFAQPPPRDVARIAANGHGNDGQIIAGRWHLHPEMAAAGLWTTPSDLARFALALWQARQGGASPLLSPAMAKQMMTKQKNEYGLGLLLGGGGDKLVSFGHDGSNVGYKCALVMLVESGQGAVVMTNGEQGGNLFGEILRGIAREYNWPTHRPVERAPISPDPAALAAYAGQYEINQANAQGVVTISVENGALYLQAPPLGGRKLALYALADDRFFMLEEDAEISFVKDARGNVTALRATTATEDVTAPRIP